MNFFTLHRNVERVVRNFNELVLDSAMEFKDTIAELNREQLWNGETSDGGTISPKYSEDPYFKTPESARRYAEWKQRITPSPKRDIDTPNLYINGMYHKSIYVKRENYYITTDSNTSLGKKIQSKYSNIRGLNVNSIKTFKPTLLDELLKRTRDELHKG